MGGTRIQDDDDTRNSFIDIFSTLVSCSCSLDGGDP